MFLWWNNPESPRRSPRKGSPQHEEEEMKGLASKLRSPPSRMTPGRSPMRSPIPSSPPANFTGRGDGDLPTGGVSRSVYSQWVHADENHRTGETMRQDLMSEVQRGEDSAAQFLLLAADHVAEARASRVGAEAARRTVQRQNAAHVSDSRRKLAQIRDAKKKTKARIAAWGAQAKQADDALKERVQQSKDEIAMKKRMSALEVAAEHEQLKARLAKESATAAERARAQVEKVQRECGSQARADAAHFYYAFRKESAEEVRQGRGEREQERSTTKAKTLQRRKAVAEKQEALIAARGSLVGMKMSRKKNADAMRESMREVQMQDIRQKLTTQFKNEEARDRIRGSGTVVGKAAEKVHSSEWSQVRGVSQSKAREYSFRKRGKKGKGGSPASPGSPGSPGSLASPASLAKPSSAYLQSRRQRRTSYASEPHEFVMAGAEGANQRYHLSSQSFTHADGRPAFRAAFRHLPERALLSATEALAAGDDGASQIDDKDLRSALRQVFNKFDADSSGKISTDEMSAMLKQLQMGVGPERMRRLMVEADPDRSGEIDFEEFVAVVKMQIAEGNAGGLADAVRKASSLFGIVSSGIGNLFSVFGGGGGKSGQSKSQTSSSVGRSPRRRLKSRVSYRIPSQRESDASASAEIRTAGMRSGRRAVLGPGAVQTRSLPSSTTSSRRPSATPSLTSNGRPSPPASAMGSSTSGVARAASPASADLELRA